MAELFEKVLLDYVAADATLAGLVTGGFYHLEAPPEPSKPYVVQRRISGDRTSLTLDISAWREDRHQFSIYVERSAAGRKTGLTIRDRLEDVLRAMRSDYAGNRVDRCDVTLGPELVEDDQYHYPVDALPEYSRS